MGEACGTSGEDDRCILGFMGRTNGKRLLGRPRSRCEENIQVDFKDVRWGYGLDRAG